MTQDNRIETDFHVVTVTTGSTDKRFWVNIKSNFLSHEYLKGEWSPPEDLPLKEIVNNLTREGYIAGWYSCECGCTIL